MKYFGLFVSIMTCVDSLGANLGIASFCLFLIIIMAYMCNWDVGLGTLDYAG